MNFYREHSRERIILELWLQSEDNNKTDSKDTLGEGKFQCRTFLLFAVSLTRLSVAPTS